MNNGWRWQGSNQDSLAWLRDVANNIDATDFGDIGPMPDKVFVLHPLHERIDGKAINDRGPTKGEWVKACGKTL